MLSGVHARLLSEKIAQIVRRITQRLGTTEHSWQPLVTWTTRLEILTQEILKANHDSFAHLASRSELTAIKTLAIALQQLQVAHKQLITELVDAAGFTFNLPHEPCDGLALRFREMHCLRRIVAEE